MLSLEDQGWAGDALPERQRIHRGALRVHATVDLVHPRAALLLSRFRAGNVMMNGLRCTQSVRTDAEMGDILFEGGVFSSWTLSQLLQKVGGFLRIHRS